MICGIVNSSLEAVVSVTVPAPHQQPTTFDAVVDTGFNGFLALPPQAIVGLQFQPAGYANATLGDGSRARMSIYDGYVLWDDQRRRVPVLESVGGPLIGMALLRDCELHVHVVQQSAAKVM